MRSQQNFSLTEGIRDLRQNTTEKKNVGRGFPMDCP